MKVSVSEHRDIIRVVNILYYAEIIFVLFNIQAHMQLHVWHKNVQDCKDQQKPKLHKTLMCLLKT